MVVLLGVGGGGGCLQGLGDAGLEDGVGGAAVHLPAPMGALGVVGLEVEIEVSLHLVEGLVPGGSALHPEVFVEERPVEALDEAVGLGPADAGGAVLDAFELEEELVGVPVGAAAEIRGRCRTGWCGCGCRAPRRRAGPGR